MREQDKDRIAEDGLRSPLAIPTHHLQKLLHIPKEDDLIPVEVGVKVTMSVKKESGETDSKTIPLKDFKSPNTPGSPEFWEDVLNNVAKYHLRPDPRQKQLPGSEETPPAEPLGKKMKKKDKPDESGAAPG